ncbi:MAG: AAA family ATPase [Gammaproteobacteria bacterium]|nr:AAA family ATPase [Gammaproteobacteria bacterium]
MTEEINESTAEVETTGAYEVIRKRLNQQSQVLGAKLAALNERRIKTFGSTRMAVIGRTRIRTENNCVPRDIKEFGKHMLFGYNVFVGMKSEISVSDVFSLHEIVKTDEGFEFTPIPFAESFLSTPQFANDFHELYRYYKEAKLSQLRHIGANKKLATFQTGKSLQDLKVFRWAVDSDGAVQYIDNRGERDNVYPPSHDFEWTATTREDHISGRHPHVSILDEVFVETVGGDLTIKLENNTEDGLGIYREPVEDTNQSLADAQIFYAKLGTLILLKIRPYREQAWRYLVFNTRTEQVDRFDAIGTACVQLPEDHGLIFPGGYYLQSGESKLFEGDDLEHMTYKRMLRSPNGEDVLYVFHHEEQGKHVLFSYNLIRKEVQNPNICHGFSIFDDGRMVVFRADEDTPSRIHPMQIWQTPYTSDEYAARAPVDGSFMARIGNAELVRGISEAYSIKHMLDEQQPTMGVYEALIAAITRTMDAYHWLEHAEADDLQTLFKEILATAELVVDEFEKVQAMRAQAQKAAAEAEAAQNTLFSDLKKKNTWQRINEFTDRLGGLRTQRGRLITLRELRYIDLAKLDELENAVVERFNELSQATVDFLLAENALTPYHTELDAQLQGIAEFTKTNEVAPLQEALDKTGEGLDLLTGVLDDLQIEEAAVRTRILEDISDIYAKLNRAKAELKLRRKELASSEATAEFGAQFKLFNQSVAGAMNQADTPEKAEEQLSRLLLLLEELESRFSEFDQFLTQIADKREEVYAGFEARKQSLQEERQRRAMHLSQAAERILQGIGRRIAALDSTDEQNAFFAADAMVMKVRGLVKKLLDLEDSVRAGDIEARLKAVRDQASRELRDKQEIYAEGGAVILLGKHRFSVNTQALDLTLVPRESDGKLQMAAHLTGTDFFQAIEDPELNGARDYWEQSLVSESPAVYRGEYLAAVILFRARTDPALLENLNKAALVEEGGLSEIVKKQAAERYDEGYERGVHDADAALILEKLLSLQANAGLLRFAPGCRGFAQIFWTFYPDRDQCKVWEGTAKSLAQLQTVFGSGWQSFADKLAAELARAIEKFLEQQQIPFKSADVSQSGAYLREELKAEPVRFTAGAAAMRLAQGFLQDLDARNQRRNFEENLRALKNRLADQIALTRAWLTGYAAQSAPAIGKEESDMTQDGYYTEAVAILLTGAKKNQVNSANTHIEIKGLLGQHPRIKNRTIELQLDEFITRLEDFIQVRVPAFRRYHQLRRDIAERERKRLRLNELVPQALTSFVRNRLINEVYLDFVGDNFAKQMGSAGEQKRTDLMGMLLLISPPGYGKTTLMEYLAQRLGLVFVKVNCPTIGHRVTSIDPAEAPSATARQELEKLNLALEMGNNVMLYLDDIQHSSPEFLQKFISMADAQRKIEGVWRGVPRTYDLRGKRFCVAMAGNPYTESGEMFKIPDMLANRADIYNLGDVLGGREEVFALSYIENALTSNPVLAPLATRGQDDVYKLIRMAQGEQIAASELGHNYSNTEISEISSVLQKLFRIQETVLKVNLQYIHSAAQADEYRTEPSFKLQGSYRNMNKLAEKTVAVMNDKELESLVTDHYQGEAQTLTSGAEENILKLAELRGLMTPEQTQRWEELKKTFTRLQSAGDTDADPVSRMVNQLSILASQLSDIHSAISKAAAQNTGEPEQAGALLLGRQFEKLGGIIDQALQQQQAQQTKQLAVLPELLKTLSETKPEVNVVNQMPSEMGGILKQLVEMIDATLLPIVSKFERKSRLDFMIWNRIKEISDAMKELDREAFTKAKAINRQRRSGLAEE